MPDDLLEEIRALRETLTDISRRLEILEQRAASRFAPAAPSILPPAQPAPSHPATAHLAERATSPTPTAAAPRENLELKIGRYWLNRVGILSLVLGTAFFLVYSIQYLGPAAKIAMGYAVGAALMILGLRLERKQGIEWYARGLLGGAWAVLYFTTYAMYHVPDTKVLYSAPLDLALLLLVAAGAVRHALTYRSQTITMLAFLLGFLTTGISQVTYFTFASSVILIGSLVILAARMRWHGLLLYGMVGSYFTHVISVQRNIVPNSWTYVWADTPAQATFWLHASFLALYWAGYTFGVLALDEREEQRRNTLPAWTIVNGLAFTLLLLPRMAPAYPRAGYIALLVIGGVYLALSPVAAKRGLTSVSTAHLLLGLTLVTLAIPQKLTHRSTSFFWLAEISLFAWVGVLFNRWAFRIFALALGYVALMWLLATEMTSTNRLVVLGYSLSWRWAIGGTAIVCYSVAAAASRHLEPHRYRWSLERQSFHLYCAAACLVLWTLTTITGPFRTVPFYWALEGSAITLLGWGLKDRGIRMFGALWFLPAVSVVLGSLGTGSWFWDLRSALTLVAALYAMSVLYRTTPPAATFSIERHLANLYVVTASLLLAGVLWHDIARNWLSLAWALEGLALVVIGFRLPDKFYRVSGLATFSILLLKVLFVDLAAAETIYRILSFAVAGAILLLASFGYTKFTGKESKPET
jgi:uncharacterized membrane protein